MATTTLSLACTASAIISDKYPNANYSGASETLVNNEAGGTTISYLETRYLYLSFEAFPSDKKYNRLYGSYINLTVDRTISSSSSPDLCFLTGAFNESTVTYNTGYFSLIGERIGFGSISSGTGQTTAQFPSSANQSAEKASQMARAQNYDIDATSWREPPEHYSATNVTAYLRTASSGLRPTLVFSYDNSLKVAHTIEANNAPTSGYVDPREATSFGWKYLRPSSQYCAATAVTQSSAALYWKASGSSTYTVVNVSGDTRSVEIAANTFPTGTSITWYVAGTRDDGTVITSTTYTFSTAAELVTATPVSPIDTIEANDAPITFSWTSYAADGGAQTYAKVEYKTDSSSWTTLGNVTGSGTSLTATASSLPTGKIYWRVIAKNIDSVEGPYSDPVSFIAYGAPGAPVVTATAKAFTTIQWQVSTQEAYKITIDGKTYGPYFGGVKKFSPPGYLQDGEHTISVQVQNSFGLWSQPGSITITVTTPTSGINRPALSIQENGPDAAIEWSISATGATKGLWLYRDGVEVAKLAGEFTGGASGSYLDRYALGEHSWQLIRNYSNNAIKSDVVTMTLKSCVTRIAPLAGGSWLELKLSDDSDRAESFSFSRSLSLRTCSGASWPVAEIGPSMNESAVYTTSFGDLESARAFEALRGKPVIVKSRGGQLMVGVLANVSKSMREFYIRYDFTIQRIYWRDWVDATGN